MEDTEYREGTVEVGPFDGGVNTFDSPDAIASNQLALGSFNYDIERKGSITRRPGNKIYGKQPKITDTYEKGYEGTINQEEQEEPL